MSLSERLFIAYFDTSGVKSIVELNSVEYEKKVTWALLTNASRPKSDANMYVRELMHYASKNKELDPEVWSFWSNRSAADLARVAKKQQAELIDLIRQNGTKIYSVRKDSSKQ